MPVKDLTGRPRRTKGEKALFGQLRRRFGKPWPPRRRSSDEDGMEPAIPPSGPKPLPLAGAASLDEGA